MLYHTTALPDLRVLPTPLLITHEDCDPRRVERLSRRILEEGFLKNPPIVSPMPGEERYVVLDGANRVMAFASLNIPHIVAQLINYDDPGVYLDTWYHVVSGMALEEFETRITEIDALQLQSCTLEEARHELEAGIVIAYIVCRRGVRKIVSASGRITPDVRLLSEIVAAYKGKADIFRGSNDIWEIQEPYYPNITALVIFPKLTPGNILNAVRNGYRLPSGITRHIIPGRALNINIPMGILMSEWDLQRKREWLQEWLMGRMGANAIRFYSESTISFNE